MLLYLDAFYKLETKCSGLYNTYVLGVSISGYILRERSYSLICRKYWMLPCNGRKEQNIFLHMRPLYLTLRMLLGPLHALHVLF